MAKRVLMVGGSADARRAQSPALSSAGYEVIEAADGPEALARLGAGRVHLVVTDLHEPNRDGVSLVRAIRENASCRLTPVVMITTESHGAEKEAGQAAGVTGWITRPFTPDQLLAVVRRVIGR